jgi:hypothetical protein
VKKDPGDLAVGRGFSLFRHRHGKGTSMPDSINTGTAIVKSARASLPELANIIRTEHAVVAQAANNVLTHALVLGRALIAAQEQLSTKPKGQWEAWLLANCRFRERHARRYTALVRAYDARGHSVPADLVDLSLRGLMRRLTPPNGPQAGQTCGPHPKRVRTAAPQQQLNSLIWAKATLTEQARFISGIGWQSLAEVLPEEWYPIIREWLQARLDSNRAPIVINQNVDLASNDLGIPAFLWREQPKPIAPARDGRRLQKLEGSVLTADTADPEKGAVDRCAMGKDWE